MKPILWTALGALLLGGAAQAALAQTQDLSKAQTAQFGPPPTHGDTVPALALKAFPGQVVRVRSVTPLAASALSAGLSQLLGQALEQASILRQGSQFLISAAGPGRIIYLDLARPGQARASLLEVGGQGAAPPVTDTAWRPSSARQIARVAASATPENAVSAGLVLHFFPLGAVLIISPEGSSALLSRGDTAALPQVLAKYPLRHLNLLMADPLESTATGHLEAVGQQYRPEYFLSGAVVSSTLKASLSASGTKIITPNDRTITLGSLQLNVLTPPQTPSNDQRGSGLVITYGTFRAVLNPAGRAAETDWLERYPATLLANADLYLGSGGDDPLWLARLQPIRTVEFGSGNRQPQDARVLRTDQRGTVSVYVQPDGETLIRTER